ncbi:hypothetical protein ABMA10_20165 [Plantibacter sp. RU18]
MSGSTFRFRWTMRAVRSKGADLYFCIEFEVVYDIQRCSGVHGLGEKPTECESGLIVRGLWTESLTIKPQPYVPRSGLAEA